MLITLNGREKNIASAANLRNLIEHCSPANTHVIAEVNGTVVKRDGWEQTAIREGDRVELVNLVGGG